MRARVSLSVIYTCTITHSVRGSNIPSRAPSPLTFHARLGQALSLCARMSPEMRPPLLPCGLPPCKSEQLYCIP